MKTIACDLLNETELQGLPEVPNVIFMAGRKFGATGNEALTWAMNTYLPGRIAEKYRNSRIVVFSTGNVYPLTPISHGGATEIHPVEPIGEYAQSCLGRERVFEHASNQFGTPLAILRLNYAIDLRYGILLGHRGKGLLRKTCRCDNGGCQRHLARGRKRSRTACPHTLPKSTDAS